MPPTRKTTRRQQTKRGGSIASFLGSLADHAKKRATYKPKRKYKGRSPATMDNHWPFPEIEKYWPRGPPSKKPLIPSNFRGSLYRPATKNQPASGTKDFKWPRRTRVTKQRGGYVGLANAALSYGVPEIMKMVHNSVGSQGGNSAGSRASRMKFGLPLTKRYR